MAFPPLRGVLSPPRAVVAGALAVLLLAGCDQPAEQARAQEPSTPPSVVVAEAVRRPISNAAEFIGRVEAVDTVDLLARVTGYLAERRFEEGQEVEAGGLLFVIEKAPFEAAVAQARAEVARAEANRDNTRRQLARALELVRDNNIPEATTDDRRAEAAVAEADLLRAQAALRDAEIDLGYTEIRAPIAGRIGLSSTTVGNVVGPDRGVLARIVSQDPIFVQFPVSSRQLLNVRQEAGAAGLDPSRFVVRATLPDGSVYEAPGEVNFLDVSVDRGTDTRLVRATFPNEQRLLVDGQFVSVRVETKAPEEALVVPQAALQLTRNGVSVLIVNGENKVEQRRVTTGPMLDQGVVIAEGLAPGDRVIVEGIQKVRPGQVVAPAPAAPPQA